MFNKLRYLLKLSMRFHIEQELLRDGNYDVVTSGTTFYDGSDMSILIPDASENTLAELGNLSAGQVWQSAFRNWVYEDVPALNPSVVLKSWPIAFRASGVYIDGAFRPTNDAVYPHRIDYLNGRIIFNSPLPLEKRVNAAFSYKIVNVMGLREFNNQLRDASLEQGFLSNPRTAGQLIYPSGSKLVSLPSIFIEDIGRKFGAYQLGDRSLVCRDELHFEIWALDENVRDNLIDLVSFQQRKSIPILNFNIVPLPLSGIYNELSPEFVPYADLANNLPLPGPSFSGINPIAFRGFLEETELMNMESLFSELVTQMPVFERANVKMTVTTYPIMPVSPFGFDTVLQGLNSDEGNPL
jgi:hypothetical protein